MLATLKENVCTTSKVKEFKVEQLNEHEAIQLFKEHAFPGKKPDEDYSKLATKFIHFAKGLPLALEIIARDLCGRPKDEWETALDTYKKIPNKDIQSKSYIETVSPLSFLSGFFLHLMPRYVTLFGSTVSFASVTQWQWISYQLISIYCVSI